MDNITDKSFKYGLEKLDSTSNEFNLVKNFFVSTKESEDDSYDYLHQGTSFQIHKVNERSSKQPVEEKSSNLMLFHGTTQKGAAGILKEGFKNSKKGWFGKGVYMTDCSSTAVDYSIMSKKSHDSFSPVFVNEVLESQKLQTFEFDVSKGMKNHNTPLKNPFNKHVQKSSRQPTEDDFRKDGKGRKYRNIEHDHISADDEFVAEENVTIPRYLITFKE